MVLKMMKRSQCIHTFFSVPYVMTVPHSSTLSHTMWEVVPVWDPLLSPKDLSEREEGFVEVDWYSTTKQPVHNLFPKMQPFSCLLTHSLISCWSVCLLPDCLYMQLPLLCPFVFRSQVVLPPAHLFTHPACLFIPLSMGLSLTAHLFVVKPYRSPLCSCTTTCLPTSSHLFVDQTYCE